MLKKQGRCNFVENTLSDGKNDDEIPPEKKQDSHVVPDITDPTVVQKITVKELISFCIQSGIDVSDSNV